jgi:hypothetical protein
MYFMDYFHGLGLKSTLCLFLVRKCLCGGGDSSITVGGDSGSYVRLVRQKCEL